MSDHIPPDEEVALLRQEVGRLTVLLRRMKRTYYERGTSLERKRIVRFLREQADLVSDDRGGLLRRVADTVEAGAYRTKDEGGAE